MEKSKKSKGILKKIILGILLLIAILITVGSITNAIISKNKKAEYNGAYGEFIETTGGKINYSVSGTGDEIIVLLPGLGSASPHYEFTELTNYLSSYFKIVTPEPLGYGLSDNTDVERTSDNICNEIHTVLSEAGYTRYYLMGHSISGIYALNYSNMYGSWLYRDRCINTRTD